MFNLILILNLILIPTSLLHSAGNKEITTGNEKGIITLEASSNGTIYRVDYTPPKSIDIESVHYIQVKAYDSSGKNFDNIYYLKSGDKSSKQNIFNLILPVDYFEPNSFLTVVIDYYTEDTTPIGSITEQFRHDFQLAFETISEHGTGIDAYRRSNRISVDTLNIIRNEYSHTGQEYVDLTREYFGSLSKEIQELLFSGSNIYILVEKVVYFDRFHDIEKISTEYLEHKNLLTEFEKTIKKYLDVNFPHIISAERADEFYNIDSVIHYGILDSQVKNKWPPYIKISLLRDDEDFIALQKKSLDTTQTTLSTILKRLVDENLNEIDAKIIELKEHLLALFNQNEQSSNEYLAKNKQYANTVSLFNDSLEVERVRLGNWLTEKKSIIEKKTTDKELANSRIDEIQQRIESVQNEITRSDDKKILVLSKKKELKFLTDEINQLQIMIENYDHEISKTAFDVHEKIRKFNAMNNQFTIVNGNTDDFIGQYSLVYTNRNAIQPERVNDISRLDAVLKSILSISQNQQNSTLSDSYYLPKTPEPTSTTLKDTLDKTDEFLNTIQKNYTDFSNTVIEQISDILNSEDFRNINAVVQDMNTTEKFDGMDEATFPSLSLVELLEKLTMINEYFSKIIYRENRQGVGEPLLDDLYDAIYQIPAMDELTAQIDLILDHTPIFTRNESSKADNRPGKINQTILTYDSGMRISIESIINHIASKNLTSDKNEISKIVHIYLSEALMENINPLIAIAQMLYHTQYFKSEEVVKETYNFGYLGSGNSESQWILARFSTPSEGIRAHIQHIKAYSTLDSIKTEIVDPRYPILLREGLIGTKNTLRDMMASWYPPKDREAIYQRVLSILDQLE